MSSINEEYYKPYQNSQAVKKCAALNKSQGEKSCEIKGSSQEITDVIEYTTAWLVKYSGCSTQ